MIFDLRFFNFFFLGTPFGRVLMTSHLPGAVANTTDEPRALLTLWYIPDYSNLPRAMQENVCTLHHHQVGEVHTEWDEGAFCFVRLLVLASAQPLHLFVSLENTCATVFYYTDASNVIYGCRYTMFRAVDTRVQYNVRYQHVRCYPCYPPVPQHTFR